MINPDIALVIDMSLINANNTVVIGAIHFDQFLFTPDPHLLGAVVRGMLKTDKDLIKRVSLKIE